MGSGWWTGLVGTAHGPLLPHHSLFLASEVFVRLVGSNRKGTSDHIPSGFPPPLSVAYSNIQYSFWASGIGPTSEMNLLLVQLVMYHILWFVSMPAVSLSACTLGSFALSASTTCLASLMLNDQAAVVQINSNCHMECLYWLVWLRHSKKLARAHILLCMHH